MLGDAHGRVGRLAAQQGRGVGGRHHHDRASQALGPQVVFQELAHFPPALADQGQHGHVALGVAGQHGEQGGLADAGAREQAEPLALAAGGEAIQRAHAEVEPRPQPRTDGGFRRGNAQRALRRPGWQGAVPVQWPPQRVEHPAKPGVGHRKAATLVVGLDRRAARAQAIERVEWHRLHHVGAKTDDLGRHAAAVACFQQQAIADRDVPSQAVHVDDEPGDAGDAAGQAQRWDAAQGGVAGRPLDGEG